MVKRFLVVKKNELIAFLIIFGVIMAGGVTGEIALNTSGENVEILSICILTYILVGMMMSVGYAKTVFNTSIGMGSTRRCYIIPEIITEFIKVLMLVMISYVAHLLHNFIFGGENEESGIKYFFKAEYMVMAVVGLAALGIFIRCMVMIFDNKAIIGFWIFWMMLCMLPSRIEQALDKGNKSIAAVYMRKFIKIAGEMDKNAWLMVIMGVSAVLLSVSCVATIKAEVKD